MDLPVPIRGDSKKISSYFPVKSAAVGKSGNSFRFRIGIFASRSEIPVHDKYIFPVESVMFRQELLGDPAGICVFGPDSAVTFIPIRNLDHLVEQGLAYTLGTKSAFSSYIGYIDIDSGRQM
jgi:hypothetical protein